MSQKLCCNCLHCARWNTSRGVECHCDIDDRYLGYLEVMDDDNNCKNWEKETKWDIQAKHDAQVRAEVISEISREMRLLYGNEYEKQIRADAIEEFKDLGKLYSEIRAEAIDECIAIVSRNDCILEDYCNQQCVECICRRLKELKEKQNG